MSSYPPTSSVLHPSILAQHDQAAPSTPRTTSRHALSGLEGFGNQFEKPKPHFPDIFPKAMDAMTGRRRLALIGILMLTLSVAITLVRLESYSRSGELGKLRLELQRLRRTNVEFNAMVSELDKARNGKRRGNGKAKLNKVEALEEGFAEEDFLGEYVDVLRGCRMVDARSISQGNVYPMVARPWGFARWTISSAGRSQPWFFSYTDRSFGNVRFTHQPSPWIGDYSYFTVHPFMRSRASGRQSEEHLSPKRLLRYQKEKFSANRVYLELVRGGKLEHTVEFTGTRHGGRIKFTYEGNNTRGIEFNNVRFFSANQPSPYLIEFYFLTDLLMFKQRLPYRDRRELVTTAIGKILLPVEAYDVDITWNGVTWKGGKTVEIILGASYIGSRQARLHMAREVEGISMERLATESKTEWNEILGRVRVKGGFVEEKKTLYTALYRATLFPSRLGEVNEKGTERHRSPYNYWRPDKVYDGPLSTDSGFWDAYRTVYPMLHLVYPDIAEEIIEGWINAIREDPNQMLPQWAAPGRVGSMVGSMGETTIAEAIVNGAVRENSLFDAYSYVKRSATVSVRNGREHMKEYAELGYVPSEFRHSTSLTLNYKLADYSVSQAARDLGDHETAELLHRRSKEWTKIFNKENLFLAPKTRAGQFTKLDPFRWQRNFTEGCAWHYRFYVPHDPVGLRRAYEGKEAASSGESVMCQKLKETMQHKPRVSGGAHIHEQREMMRNGIGLYAHNNQPVHHMLYMFSHAGCAISGQEYIFKALQTQYGSFGYSGDEDNGEMSSWYILSSLGLYALAPGSGSYQVGATPLFKEILISRKKGSSLYITRSSNRSSVSEFKPAKVVVWNGQQMDIAHSTAKIPYKELLKGGILLFE